MRKLSKTTYGFIFTIILLIISLGIVLYLAISGWFYTNMTKLESDMKIGQTVNIDIDENEAQVVSFTIPGAYLPGQKIDQFINISNVSDKDLFIRAKIVIFDFDKGEEKMQVGTTDHWTEYDGRYFYNEKLLSANKIAFASYVKLLDTKYFDSTKSYVVSIVVESLDANLDRTAIWGY